MTNIKAFEGYLVAADRASEVVSPAYDSVSPEQRRIFAENHPDNFLNTMRLQEDFSEENQPSSDELLYLNKANLDRLLSDGSFCKFGTPCLFLYQLQTGDHIQTGVVCEVGVEEYENNRLRKHENTRSDKEDLLANYQKVVGASSSPICLAYSQHDGIDSFVSEQVQNPPDLEFTSEDGVQQKVWCIESEANKQTLQSLFQEIDVTYLTDGHHRAASGHRYAEWMRDAKGNQGNEPYNQLLVALFPDNQLNLLPFHRCVKGLNGLTEEEIVAALDKCFEVEKLEGQSTYDSTAHGEFGMYINETWYRLNVKSNCIENNDPVNSLDVTLLQNLILDPILGIKDMRSDPRLDYVAGVGGDAAVKEKYADGWDVIFSCFATSIDQLMNVADADALMPPKSTYFDPKPRSGIFVRLK